MLEFFMFNLLIMTQPLPIPDDSLKHILSFFVEYNIIVYKKKNVFTKFLKTDNLQLFLYTQQTVTDKFNLNKFYDIKF